eukprot:COSAG02_NODE_1096_length_14601_cov_185.142946_12_plen_125_part_00
MLEADYSIQCWTGSSWWFVAFLSALGALVVSIGAPGALYLYMRRDMNQQLEQADHLKKSRVVAYRDFHRSWGYVCGEFKSDAYYAECVDLARKLMMTGVLTLLAVSLYIYASSCKPALDCQHFV